MKNIEKYQSLLASGEVDALLLTSEYNRLYAAQYGVAEGVAVVTKEGAYYFTDSRYIEAAENNLPGFTVRMTHPGSSEVERINEVIGEHTIKKLGFEESDMTYATFLEFQHALHAVLVPMQKKIDAFRASKEPWELELMRKAQEIIAMIGERDFSVNVISKSGTTTEPAIAFRIFKELLEKKYGKEGARERIYATTDKARGALKTLATKEGYETFVVPDDVGGRYSVLTAVGLLPIAAAK